MAGVLGEEANVFDAAVTFGVVHAVADDELIGDLEGDVVGLDGDESAVGLVEAGGDLERGGLVLQHHLAKEAEGEAGIEDVFDQDDVLAFDGIVDVLDELDGAGGDTGPAVAGDGDEVEGVVDLDGAGEVSEEDGCSLENTDEHDGLAFVFGRDLCADLADACLDLLSGEEDFHGLGGRKKCGRCGCRTGGHKKKVREPAPGVQALAGVSRHLGSARTVH